MRCLLADDHPALVRAVGDYLRDQGYSIVGPARDGEEAVALAASAKPDLAVVDMRMPRLGGIELLERIAEVSPATRIAVYTAEADEALAGEALAAGAAAIVLKEAPLSDLARALQSVRFGRPYVDPSVSTRFGAAEQEPKPTPRELAVLSLIADGLSHDQIGAALSISPETVRSHVRNVCERLQAHSRTHAVAKALRLGLIA